MQQDLLFELGTEELPPLALQKLSNALAQGFIAGLKKAGLAHGEIKQFAAPRRLGLLIRQLEVQQADQDIERRGPSVKAAFDQDGNPTKAASGFASSCGTTVDKLQTINAPKGDWLMFQQTTLGKSAAELLPAIAEQSLNQLPIPKRMRWGTSEVQFVRPVHWLLFLQGTEVVPCTLLDAKAGNVTYGHRFHHPQAIEISHPDKYEATLLEKGRVIACFEDRRARIDQQIHRAAEALGAVIAEDAALLDEVTALNEWPIPITGSFEERFLAVPQEALILTMKKNQKYFPLLKADGQLHNHFITVANIDSPRPELISEGNERVIRPRLADAMFFWEQDAKQTLAERMPKLKTVVFQKQLGSMDEKSLRVAKLASRIAELIGGNTQLAERAGLLSRCDLLTEMVNEFADMQGIMGRYQAQRDGEPSEVAQALEEFYLPRFSGDQLPQTKTGIAIALAERLDTLNGIFGIGMKPTGDKDPFALRRAALGVLRIVREHSLTLDIKSLLDISAEQLAEKIDNPQQTASEVHAFLLERLKRQFLDQAVAAPLFAAVAAIKPLLLTDYETRIAAVSSFAKLPEADALAAANKRIANILKKATEAVPDSVDNTLFNTPEENSLAAQIDELTTSISPLLDNADYTGVLTKLAGLKDSVDAFFDQVMVNVDDPAVRGNRLALLQQLQALFLTVADISLLNT